MKRLFSADKLLVSTFLILLAIGLLFFLSAAMGILASNTDKFASIVKTQLILGFLGGITVFLIALRIKSEFWQKYAPVIFFSALAVTALVYIPYFSLSHGGARRWIDIGPISLQPAEFLKAAALVYLAALYSKFLKKKNNPNSKGETVNLFQLLAPALVVLFLCGAILLPQPDTKSFVLIFLIASSLLFVSGLPYRLIGMMVGVMALLGVFLIMTKPYVASRFETFLHPDRDTQGASYQLQQSLIAFGSGGIVGQGFGQSVQKFNFLPEPHGDSIFAVVGEEVGFVGSSILIILYLIFIMRGIKLAQTMESAFARLFFIGFFALFAFQTFLNVGSSSGVIPLTGVPLPLMSHGGTSLFITIGLFGIIIRLLYEKQNLAK